MSLYRAKTDLIAKPVLHSQAELGEGAIWNTANEKLYWVDIDGRAFHVYDPITNADKIFPTPERVSTVVPMVTGNVLLALQNGIHEMNIKTGKLSCLINPITDSNIRFNDGKCDPAGRFWVGTFEMNLKENVAVLYRMDHDKSIHVMQTNVTNSNGIAWSLDKTTLYYIDTPTQCVFAFDYNNETGNISRKRIAIQIDKSAGLPDGMTIDAEGKLWIALWGGACVTRYDPDTGLPLQSVKVPALLTSSCAFGGRDLNILYITTARKDLTKSLLEEFPLSGDMFAVATDIPGVKSNVFGITN